MWCFVLGGIICLAWGWIGMIWKSGGTVLIETASGFGYPIQASIFLFILGMVIFGIPLWLFFG